MLTVQNSYVPTVSEALGSNQVVPDISESSTRTRAKDPRPGPPVEGEVDPYDS